VTFLLLVAVFVLVALVGREVDVEDGDARVGVLQLRVGAEVAYEDDFVDGTCHDATPLMER
jgi:hypothetical protein